MLNLRVLRFMGVLTIMKLGLVAVSVICLLLITTWVVMYCPQSYYLIKSYRMQTTPSPMSLVADIDFTKEEKSFDDIDEYFEYHEKKLVEEIKLRKQMIMEKKEKELEASNTAIVLPMHLYTDEVFQSMVSQTNIKEVDDYEKFAETPQIQIYRKPKEGGLYEYKMYAYLENFGPEQIANAFMDNEYRLYWDKYITEIFDVEKHDVGPNVVYFNVDFPWPLGDRDYVYTREVRKIVGDDGNEYIVIIMHSVDQKKVPEKKGRIRIYDYHQSMSLTNYKDHGTKVFIHYSDNPRGSIPKFLVNWAAKTGVPEFLDALEEACRGYPAYLKEMEKTRSVKTN